MVYSTHYLIEKVRSEYEGAGCILIIYVIAMCGKESHLDAFHPRWEFHELEKW